MVESRQSSSNEERQARKGDRDRPSPLRPAVRRYKRVTGQPAMLDGTGQVFETITELRVSTLSQATS